MYKLTGSRTCKQIQSKVNQNPRNSPMSNTPKHTRIKTRTQFWIQKGHSDKPILLCWGTCTGSYVCDTAYVCLFSVAIQTWSCTLKLVVKVALRRLALLGVASSISPYLKHYEGLSYDREVLHRRHLRARRAAASEEKTLRLDFTAFHRWFQLFLLFFFFISASECLHVPSPGFACCGQIYTRASELHVFFQDFPPAFETWLASFFRKFHCDHWKRAHVSRPFPLVLRNIGGWVSHGTHSSNLNYDGSSSVSSLFPCSCFDLKAKCASVFSTFWLF